MFPYLLALALAPTVDTQFTVENRSGDVALREVYFGSDAAEGWGVNIIAGEEVLPGEALRLGGVRAHSYSVRLVDEYGAACEMRDIDPQTHSTFAFTPRGCFAE